MKYIILIFISIVFFTSSCNSVSKEYEKGFFSYLVNISPKTEISGNYFIIPSSACHSCIESIYEIIKAASKSQNTTIVLVGFHRNDSVQVKTEFPNCTILLDKKGYLYNLKNDKIKTYIPIFLKIKNKKITGQLIFSLDKLEDNLINLSEIL